MLIVSCYLKTAEVEFLGLEPFVVAVTAICCASDEILPFRTHQFKDLMLKYIPFDEVTMILYVIDESFQRFDCHHIR